MTRRVLICTYIYLVESPLPERGAAWFVEHILYFGLSLTAPQDAGWLGHGGLPLSVSVPNCACPEPAQGFPDPKEVTGL